MNHPVNLDALGRHTPWDGVRAVIAGFGVSGYAAADNLLFLGADVTALDETSSTEKAEQADASDAAAAPDPDLPGTVDAAPRQRLRLLTRGLGAHLSTHGLPVAPDG